MRTLTKTELVERLAECVPLSPADVRRVLGYLEDICTVALAAGDRVRLPGLGTLEVVDRAARTGRNPQTGEPVEIPARSVVKFKPAKSLREALNDD